MQTTTSKERSNPLYYLLRRLGGDFGDSTWLALGFVVGALAFAWAGFVNNPTSSNPLIHAPWSVFFFFCGIMIVLEASILLDPKLPQHWRPSRARVNATLAVTVACIVIVATVYLVGWKTITNEISTLIQTMGLTYVLAWLSHRQVVFTVANIFCIVVLWLGVRFATYDREAAAANGRATFHGERLVGDLALSTILSWILAVVFFAPFWQFGSYAVSTVSQTSGAAPAWSYCDFTYKPSCPLATPFAPTTLSFADLLIIPAIYVVTGLAILVVAAVSSALQRGRAYESVGVFLETLSDILRRRVTIPNLLRALRYIWPLLLLLAAVLIGLAAKSYEYYLYDVGQASHGAVFWWATDSSRLIELLILQFGSVAALATALVATVSAATMQIVPRRVRGADMRRDLMLAWRHIGFWAGTFAVLYWAISLMFTLINWLIITVSGVVASGTGHGYAYAPFVQPDPLMALSLVVFVIYIARYLRRRRAAPGPG